jgi:hypothetical protein
MFFPMTLCRRLWARFALVLAATSALTFTFAGADTRKAGVRADAHGVLLQTEHLVYAVGKDGMNQAFRDRRTGRSYLDASAPGHFMSIEKGGKWIGSSAVELVDGFLQVKYGDAGRARVRVRSLSGYLTFELIDVIGQAITSIQLARLPLTLTQYVSHSLTSCRSDEYAAAVIPLNIETCSYPTRGKRAVLTGFADAAVQLKGAKVAVLGCPTDKLLDIIERVEIENGLPHPTLGGVWARRSPEQMKSYLFVDLSEASADAMIQYALAGGFGYIVIYDGIWNGSQGSYPVNRKYFPSGEAGLKAVSARIHAAGLKFGMHNLDMVVSKTDPLVHPVPTAGFLMYPDRRRILAADIGPADRFLPTTVSPAGLLAKSDKSRFHGRDLRIGNEIIVYDALQISQPFGFRGCTRGAHRTVAAAHKAGAPIDNFSEFIGYYRPDVRGDLYDRVARAGAAALDRFEFDYIYPDGIGENLGYWPEGPLWYVNNLLVSKLFRYTRREVLFGHGPVSNFSWHVFSRGNTTDFVNTGIIEHFDRVSVAGAARCREDLQPFEFGWFGYFTHSLAGEATALREMEYAWSKALAYGAAMSLETSKATLDANGRTREIFATIKKWEELKLADYFPERIKQRLREPGRDFTLEQAHNGAWQVRPVTYGPEHYVDSLQGKQNVWTFANLHPDQPLRATIRMKPRLAEYGAASNVVLLAPGPLNLCTAGAGPLGGPRQSSGVEFDLKPCATEPPAGGTSFEVGALNKGTSAAGWGCAEVILDRAKNLTRHRALGTWVHGDGSGAYLHFVLEDAGRWSVRDYYVRLDFTGWRYVRIPECAKGEVYNFGFPYSNYWAIRSIDYGAIARIYVFLTHLAPRTEVKARFSRLEALHEDPLAVRNPGLSVNKEVITFPVTLERDWYLEYQGSDTVRLFDPNGYTKSTARLDQPPPMLRKGNNEVRFFCDRGKDRGETVNVMLITRGEPLR